MSKRKILSLAMALSIVAIMAVGATLAYFTDTDEATNVFTVGNVKIVQHENDRTGAPYVNPQPSDGPNLFPIVNDSTTDGFHNGKNYIDKFVTVENTGNLPAYVRTYVAFPNVLDDGDPSFDASKNILHWNGASDSSTSAASKILGTVESNDWYWGKSAEAQAWPGNAGDWNAFMIKRTSDGVVFNVYVATHNTAVEAGKRTMPNLTGVYMDKNVDNAQDDEGNTYYTYNGEKINYDFTKPIEVLVLSEAVQIEGFADAWTALDQAFGVEGTYCPFEGYELV